MCHWDHYCCRVNTGDANCCNNTAAVSSNASPLGLPTQAAVETETMTLSVVMSSGRTSPPTTTALRTAAVASNPTCASAVGTEHCLGSSKTMAVGAGVGVSLGTFLIATLVALVVLMRRQKDLRRRLARTQEISRAQESAMRELEKSVPISQQESINELWVPTPSVNELWVPTHNGNELDGSRP